MSLKICELCLEKRAITYDLLGNAPNENEKRDVLRKHIGFMFSTDNIDSICSDCWQKIKDFDDYCKYIENVHQMQAFDDADEPFESNCDVNELPLARDEEVDTKPSLPELQAAIAEQHNTPIDFSRSIVEMEPIIDIVIKEESSDVSAHSEADNGEPSLNDAVQAWMDVDSENDFPAHSWIEAADKKFRSNVIKTKKKAKPDPTRAMCELCGIISNNLRQHERHYEAVHMDNTYDCDICGKRTLYKAGMYDHMRRVHIKREVIQYVNCDICDKRVSKWSLRDHILRHNKIITYPFQCFMCGKGFLRKEKLKEHETIHTGELPLECAECDKRFRFSSSLALHRKKVHKMHIGTPQ